MRHFTREETCHPPQEEQMTRCHGGRIVCHLFSRLDRIIGAFVDTHVKRLEEENRLSIVIQPASLAQEHA